MSEAKRKYNAKTYKRWFSDIRPELFQEIQLYLDENNLSRKEFLEKAIENLTTNIPQDNFGLLVELLDNFETNNNLISVLCENEVIDNTTPYTFGLVVNDRELFFRLYEYYDGEFVNTTSDGSRYITDCFLKKGRFMIYLKE